VTIDDRPNGFNAPADLDCQVNQPSDDSTASVRRHYDTLLAEHYSWMRGDFEPLVEQTVAQLQSLSIPRGPGRALDLGCGSGIQTMALARLNYEVVAVDFSPMLLRELADRAGGLPIRTVEADLTQLRAAVDLGEGFDVIVCMGDTLTHLPTFQSVEHMLNESAAALRPGGAIVLEFRDLSAELTGADRWIPVRLEADRLMITFLEYLETRVMVHDAVLERRGETWQTSKSAYPKLRLAADRVRRLLEHAGLAIRHESLQRGLCRIAAFRA
jgi:SAM-dependent methyltransferase